MPSSGNSTLAGRVTVTSCRPMRSTSDVSATRLPLADDRFGRLVVAQALEARLAQLAAGGPFVEGALRHQLRLHPVHAQLGQPVLRERALGRLQLLEPGAQLAQRGVAEAGAHLAGELQRAFLVVADQQ